MNRRTFSSFAATALATAFFGRTALDPDDAVADEAAPARVAHPKQCVVLWMNGGPSHIDTFDPKSGEVAGPGKSIATKTRDVRVSEHLPLLAEKMDKIALLRGVTSKEGNHQRAQELGHTGHTPNPTVAAPSLGAWMTKKRPASGLEIPQFVSLGGPSSGGGFFGHGCDPFVVQKPGALPDDLGPVRKVSRGRDDARRALLGDLDASFAQRTGDSEVAARTNLYARARAMMGAKAVHAFEIDEEPESVQSAYGDSDFGRGCLVARRLVEVGVPFVEVTLDKWDTHEDNFGRTKALMGALDPAMSSLLGELEARGLLDTTLVLCMGEFGRTPRINAREGRDHHPGAFSVAMAGAGIRGGVVHGQTDATGDTVVKDAVTVPDVLATAASCIGVDPALVEFTPAGRPISVTQDGKVIRAIVA
jgi:hypothetical protein